FLIALALFWKATTRWEVFLVFFTVGFCVVLSFSIIPAFRYNLPVIALLHLMTGLVIVKCGLLLKRPFNWIVLIPAVPLVVPLQAQRCLNFLGQFANDSRLRLRSFLAHDIAPGSLIVADGFALQEYDDDPRLTDNERQLLVKVKASFWAADLGGFDALRAS